MLIKTKNFSDKEFDRFKKYQNLSFEILSTVAQELVEGVTEKEVARKLVKLYRQEGVASFFHLPVALFGERTALPGDWSIGHFFPRSRTLMPNDPVILDAAPLFNGFLVDTSYSLCFGKDSEHDAMMLHLSSYRESIREAVNQGQSFKSIAEAVESTMLTSGYKPVHQKHPGEVLGHRAIKTTNLPFRPKMQGFDAISLSWFKFMDGLAHRKTALKSPLWNSSEASEHAPHDGLWLVEPHAGNDRIGAKWEEILVIENGQAHWLDDNPPHVEYWAKLSSVNHAQ